MDNGNMLGNGGEESPMDVDEGVQCNEERSSAVGTRVFIGGSDYYNRPSYPEFPEEDFNLTWHYGMRRSMQEIIPGVYLGSYASVTRDKLDDMKSAGLTHVICVREVLERNLIRVNHSDHFKYLVVEVADSLTGSLIPHFATVQKFVDECLAAGGKVLLHGNAGVSRSAAFAVAYIMSKFGVTAKEGYQYVQMKRYCVFLNADLMSLLREYEPIYRAQHTVPIPLPQIDSGKGSEKRKRESPDRDDYPVKVFAL